MNMGNLFVYSDMDLTFFYRPPCIVKVSNNFFIRFL